MKFAPLLVLACVSMGAPGCADDSARAPVPQAAAAAWAAVTPVTSPGAPGSSLPQMTVTNGRALLSWVERSGSTATLKFAERTADGWSAPRTVASGTNWFVNWADVPSVLRLADRTLAAHWLQKSGDGTYAYDVRLAFSKDDGRTWSASVTPHHDGTQTEHGFASLFQMPGAGLGLVWLDGRAMKAGHHGGGDAGAMTIRGAVFDGSGQQVSEVALDERVCECCPTAVAVTADGPIAAFRNRSEDEIRDIYVSRLVDGRWTESVPVHADNWRIPACPVNGPALAARDRRVAIAWFTLVEGTGRAFVAFSDDAGATFGAPVRLDDAATHGRVDIELLEDGSAAATWLEVVGEQAEFRVRRIDASGARGAALTVAPMSGSRASGYPRMARQGSELLFAWTETGDAPIVRTARVTVPE